MKADGLASNANQNEIEEALLVTMQEMSDHEVWAVPAGRLVSDFGAHAIRIFSASVRSLPPSSRARRIVRQSTIRIIAYLPAAMRISLLFSLARMSQLLIHDLMKGDIDSEFEPHRYNIIVTLGIFARNGLFLGVTEPSRIGRVQAAILEAKRLQARTKGESNE